MSEKELTKEKEVFFTFDTKESVYEIVIPNEDENLYGSILHKQESEKEILSIEDWVTRFVKQLGFREEVKTEDVLITRDKEDESVLFNGPFGSLKISRACNLTYNRIPI